ncbi:hypothetical protein DOY81_012858, partial [Sarcophaga bullata]
MFSTTEFQKTTFLEQTKAAREERALEKRREWAAIKLQSTIKGFLARRRYQKQIIEDFDRMIVGGGGGGSGGSGVCEVGDDKKDPLNLHASSNVYPVIRRFLTTYKLDKNCEETRDRFERLCRYLNKSMETEAPKLSYATLCLQKDK